MPNIGNHGIVVYNQLVIHATVSNSGFSVYDDVPWIHKLKAFVKKLHENKKKLVGICFGHQMVAEALEGNVSKAGSGWSVGVQSNSLNEASQHYGFQQNDFLLCSNHQDQVTELPSGAKVLAGNEICPIAAMGIEDHILTFQGHPEFSEGYARALLDMRREIFGEELYQSAIDSLHTKPDNQQIASRILEFVSRP